MPIRPVPQASLWGGKVKPGLSPPKHTIWTMPLVIIGRTRLGLLVETLLGLLVETRCIASLRAFGFVIRVAPNFFWSLRIIKIRDRKILFIILIIRITVQIIVCPFLSAPCHRHPFGEGPKDSQGGCPWHGAGLAAIHLLALAWACRVGFDSFRLPEFLFLYYLYLFGSKIKRKARLLGASAARFLLYNGLSGGGLGGNDSEED